MVEFIRIILMLAIAGAAVTFFGRVFAWWMDEQRRLRRLVRKVLGGRPDAVIVASGRGAAAGFRLTSGHVVVMRDEGASALLYRIHSLVGAELIVDDHVVARVMRDEARRTLDQVNSGATQVTLRLLFDDARYPDFSLDLWIPRDSLRRDARPASAAIREARSWLSRAEAIMRRVAAYPPEPTPPSREHAPEVVISEIPNIEPRDEDVVDKTPPWEEEDEAPINDSGQPRLL